MVNSNWNINVWRNVSNLNSDEGGLLVKPGRRSWQWRTGAVFRQIPHFTSLIGVTHQILLPPTFHHHHSWSSSKLSLLSKFSSLMIMIKTLFVLTALGKVRVFAFAVIAGPINKRMGHPGPQNCAQQTSAEHKFQFAG